jgi:membrane associated rhomboid family serine protease
MRIWPMTDWIIGMNVVIFILDVLGNGWLTQLGAFSISAGISHLQLWRFISSQFLHAGPVHLFFNMLWLYYLGRVVEPWLGKRRFVAFYLLCGVVAVLSYVALHRAHVIVGDDQTQLVGASGAIFGVMAAAVGIAPGFRVRLIFPPVTLTLRAMLWIMIGMALFTIRTGGWNAGGEAAHIGGAAAGYLLIRQRQLLTRLSGAKQSRFWRPGDSRGGFFRKDA